MKDETAEGYHKDLKDVAFTRDDLEFFAKSDMRGWMKRYKVQTDEDAKNKKAENDRKGRRLTRRRQVRNRHGFLSSRLLTLVIEEKKPA